MKKKIVLLPLRALLNMSTKISHALEGKEPSSSHFSIEVFEYILQGNDHFDLSVE